MSTNEFEERRFDELRGRATADALREDIRQGLAEQAGGDVSAEDIVVEETEDGQLRGRVPRDVIRQQAAADLDRFGPGDLVVEETGDGISARPSEEAQRREAVESIQDSTDINIGPDDLAQTGSGFQLSDQTRRREAVESLQKQTQTDLKPADISLNEDGAALSEQARRREAAAGTDFEPSDLDVSGGSVEVRDSVRQSRRSDARQEAIEEIDQQTAINVSSDDINVSGDSISLNQSAQRRERARQFNAQIDALQGSSFIEPGDVDPGTGELTDEARKEVAALQARDQFEAISPAPDDFSLTGDGVELDRDVQRELAASQLDSEFGPPVEPADVEQTGDGFELRDEFRRALGANELEEDLRDGDPTFRNTLQLDSEDVELTNQGVELSDSGRQTVTAIQLDEQLPQDIGERDVTIQGGEARLRDELLREVTAQEISQGISDDVSARLSGTVDETDIEIQSGDARLSDVARSEIAAARIETGISDDALDAVDGIDGSDLRASGGEFQLRGDTARRINVARLQGDTETDIEPADLEFTDDQQFVLNESALRQEAVASIQDETTTEIDAGDLEQTDDQFALTDQALLDESAAQTEFETGDLTVVGDQGDRAAIPTFDAVSERSREQTVAELNERVPGSREELVDRFNSGDPISPAFDVTGDEGVGSEDVQRLTANPDEFERAQRAAPQFTADDVSVDAPVSSRRDLVRRFGRDEDLPDAFDVTGEKGVDRADVLRLLNDADAFERAQAEAVAGSDLDVEITDAARRRERIEAFDANRPGLDIGQDDVTISDGTIGLTDEARVDAAIGDIQPRTASDIDESDVRLTDDGTIELTDEARDVEAGARLERRRELGVGGGAAPLPGGNREQFGARSIGNPLRDVAPGEFDTDAAGVPGQINLADGIEQGTALLTADPADVVGGAVSVGRGVADAAPALDFSGRDPSDLESAQFDDGPFSGRDPSDLESAQFDDEPFAADQATETPESTLPALSTGRGGRLTGADLRDAATGVGGAVRADVRDSLRDGDISTDALRGSLQSQARESVSDAVDSQQRALNSGDGAAEAVDAVPDEVETVARSTTLLEDDVNISGPEINPSRRTQALAAVAPPAAPALLAVDAADPDQTAFVSGPAGDLDRGVTETLAEAEGFIPSGTREVDRAGELEVPSDDDLNGTDADTVKRQIAAENPGVGPEDITVNRRRIPGSGGAQTRTEFGVDLDAQDVRERIAAENEGVSAADVQFQDTDGDGQREPVAQTSGAADVDLIPSRRTIGLAAIAPPAAPALLAAEAADPGSDFPAVSEAGLRDRVQSRRETVDVSDGVEEEVEAATGSETAGSFAGGGAAGVADLAVAPETAALTADRATEIGQQLPEAVQQEGARATGTTLLEQSGRVTESQSAAVEEDPARFAGQIAAEFAAGGVASKSLDVASDVSRSARVRARADSQVVDLRDLTTEKGLEGETPEFDTSPNAPDEEAVAEVRQRAADNPDEITTQDRQSALFHTTEDSLPADLEVEQGGSELPGLFTSPEASPLGLDLGDGTFEFSLRPEVPGSSSDELVTLPGDDVRAMDPDATGAGNEVRDPETGEQVEGGLGRGEAKARAEDTDLEVRPDQTTSGFEFLTERADEGAAFVRPSGSRTPELEAIFPPGSQFEEVGTTPVRIGRRRLSFGDREVDIPFSGRLAPVRRFERADVDADNADDIAGAADADAADDVSDTVEATEVPTSRIDTSSGSPTVFGGITGSVTGTVDGETDVAPSSSRRFERADVGADDTDDIADAADADAAADVSDTVGRTEAPTSRIDTSSGSATVSGGVAGEVELDLEGETGGSTSQRDGDRSDTGGSTGLRDGLRERNGLFDSTGSSTDSSSGGGTTGPTSGSPTSGGFTTGGSLTGGATSGGFTTGGSLTGGATSGGGGSSRFFDGGSSGGGGGGGSSRFFDGGSSGGGGGGGSSRFFDGGSGGGGGGGSSRFFDGGSGGGGGGGGSGGGGGGGGGGGTGIRRTPDLPRPDLEVGRDRDSQEDDLPELRAESDATATGFLSETVATIATGGSLEAGRAPDQETLEDRPAREQLVGELPTAAFLGDAETREDISETQDLLLGIGNDDPRADDRRRGEARESPLLDFGGGLV